MFYTLPHDIDVLRRLSVRRFGLSTCERCMVSFSTRYFRKASKSDTLLEVHRNSYADSTRARQTGDTQRIRESVDPAHTHIFTTSPHETRARTVSAAGGRYPLPVQHHVPTDKTIWAQHLVFWVAFVLQRGPAGQAACSEAPLRMLNIEFEFKSESVFGSHAQSDSQS